MRNTSIVIGIVLLVLIGILILPHVVGAAKFVDKKCRLVEIVYANGSGETTADAKGYSRFSNQLASYFGADDYNLYRLGRESYGGARYDPVSVGLPHPVNSIGAWYGSGIDFAYGKSVEKGEIELKSYLQQRFAKCSSVSHFVLAGYSQGAQVVGESLAWIPLEIRNKVAYVGLFGDPKLNLPEGRGWNPPSCRTGVRSPWRRIVANCDVDSGSLGAREFYLPTDMEHKTGLWCYAHDFVCGSSKDPLDISGHGQYAGSGAAIDGAVGEAYAKLLAFLPSPPTEDTISQIDFSHYLTGHDYVVMVDPGDLDAEGLQTLRERAQRSVEQFAAMGADVELAEALTSPQYPEGYRLLSGLQEGMAGFEQGLEKIDMIDHCQIVGEEQLSHSVSNIIHNTSWTPGGTPELIYIAGGNIVRDCNKTDYDREDEASSTAVAQARNSGGVQISAMAPVFSPYSNQLGALVRETSGYFYDTGEVTLGRVQKFVLASQSVSSTGDPIVDQMIKDELSTPMIKFDLDALMPQPGDVVNFDVSNSAAKYPNIVRYEWDFDNDGNADKTTTVPQTQYTYSTDFNGYAKVTAVTSDDYSGSATIKVTVADYKPPVLPQSPSNLKVAVLSTKDGKSSVKLSWKLPAKLPDKYLLRINDYPSGTLDNTRTSVNISDVERSDDVTFSLVGIDQDWNEGEPSLLVLPKRSSSIDPISLGQLSDNTIGAQEASDATGTEQTEDTGGPQPIKPQKTTLVIMGHLCG